MPDANAARRQKPRIIAEPRQTWQGDQFDPYAQQYSTEQNEKDPGRTSGLLDSVHPFQDNLIAATALTPESYN
ncbi:MAG: hypothetical protein M0Z73_02535 [Betaproteobacteria bacterium]|nr:hypothetical protein [Betaproteobacteria bacterium]